MIINKIITKNNINYTINKISLLKKFSSIGLHSELQNIHNSTNFNNELEILKNKVQHQTDIIHSNQAQLLNTTLDNIFPSNNTPLDKVIASDIPLEPNYHLLYHPSHLPENKLGKDGYDPDFAPPHPYVDRVWAKGKLEFNPDNLIRVGQKIDLKTKTHQINQTLSASKGPMICVDLLKEYSNLEGTCLKEYRTLCYFMNIKDQVKYGYNTQKSNKIIKTRTKPYDLKVEVNPNSLLLFRYSALTFNAHKIHYDFNYANGVEGYPDILVHGPLTTTLTLKLITQYLSKIDVNWQSLKSFDYKLFQPLFNNQKFSILLKLLDNNSLDVWVDNIKGELAFRGNAKY